MKLKCLLLTLLFVFPSIVNAKEVYYVNDNKVSLTKREYNYIVERFSKNFLYIMTKEDYNNLISDELLNSKINAVISNNILPLSNYHETNSKSIKITSACTSTICNITVTVNWFKNPNVRSYDVIGAYLSNISLINQPTTKIYTSTNSSYSNELVSQQNGFGISIKVPSGSNIELFQYYNTEKSGTIYASYQHAKSSISLANSKKYTIALSGYGGVFLFDSSVKDNYDAMGGVNINV